MNIPILYEDNHLLIVEKPNNIPVQQDKSNDNDLLSMLKEDIKIRYNKPGNVYLSLIHRLDRPVGGAILFAKTSKAASRMANLFRKREINRSYLAIVRGIVRTQEEKLIHYLRKDEKRNKVFAVDSKAKDAKKAILHYKLLETKENMSLLLVQLETGRSHQIRVQLQQIGHPLFGDQKYGQKVNKVGEQIALWSHELTFNHPVKQEQIVVKSYPSHDTYPWNLCSIS